MSSSTRNIRPLVSGTGLLITTHALRRWLERFDYEMTLFSLESHLHSAIKHSGKNMGQFIGKAKIYSADFEFVLNNRTVITCYPRVCSDA